MRPMGGSWSYWVAVVRSSVIRSVEHRAGQGDTVFDSEWRRGGRAGGGVGKNRESCFSAIDGQKVAETFHIRCFFKKVKRR